MDKYTELLIKNSELMSKYSEAVIQSDQREAERLSKLIARNAKMLNNAALSVSKGIDKDFESTQKINKYTSEIKRLSQVIDGLSKDEPPSIIKNKEILDYNISLSKLYLTGFLIVLFVLRFVLGSFFNDTYYFSFVIFLIVLLIYSPYSLMF